MGRLHQRIVVDAGADGGEGHRAAAVLQRQRQAAAVAGGQLGGLAVIAAPPDGAGGVDDVSAGQVIAAGDAGLTGGAAVQRFALGHETRSGSTVDGTIHPGTAQ